MKGIYYAIIISGACLCSCAAPRVTPRFTQPSTAPIARSITDARKNVSSAKDKAKAIEQAEANPQVKLQIIELRTYLDNALQALDTSESERLRLDEQLKNQTNSANKLADDHDKAQAKIKSQSVTIDKVNSYWGLGAFAYGLGVLFKHLLILALVVVVALAILFGLSLAFPAIGGAISFVSELAGAAIKRIRDVVRKRNPP
jgi:hypothetical protein